jgi:alcohol dehydrogenase class IV
LTGHALGATYQIPHGITSCLTLASVIRYKAVPNSYDAAQLARLAPLLGIESRKTEAEDAQAVGQKVEELVSELGLKSTLTEYGVPNREEEWEAIANRALHGNTEHPDFKAVVEIVKGLY